jgi:hypothetical protein
MNSYGFLWISMDSYGFLWIPMDSYGFLWIPMNSYGFLWISMDSYGFLWIPMDFNAASYPAPSSMGSTASLAWAALLWRCKLLRHEKCLKHGSPLAALENCIPKDSYGSLRIPMGS